MLNRTNRVLAVVLFAAIVVWTGVSVRTGPSDRRGLKPRDKAGEMSDIGRAAAKTRKAIARVAVASAKDPGATGSCLNEPDCADEEFLADLPAQTQSETSIAVDSSGLHIVVGFNDFRGFSGNPVSLSGFMYSDDGGQTFVDGGQLPSPGNDTIGSTKLPQVFGDPEVKYIGNCTFIYSSILVKKFSATTAAQTMGVHRSTDCGHTWAGPFEVTAATNPNGVVDVNGGPTDDADKEFMDVDPDTGRVVISWSNFTPTRIEISTSYTDNITANPPTWSPRKIVANSDADGQASIPRFAGGHSKNAYVAWVRFFDDLTNTIAFARSTDNGATWSAPVEIPPSHFFTMDYVLGNDRVNSSPSLAVDKSFGGSRGNIYVVYATNDLGDGADIAFQRSKDDGLTFSKPILLNSRPGEDRAQWFPWVTVDSTTGRIHVFYYDQGIASSGDLTQVTHTFSDDGGKSWEAPLPLTRRPFHAGWGNDSGQPNLGDYNQAVAQSGDFFVVYAEAKRPPAGFADGQPTSASMTVPDVVFGRLSREGRESEHHGLKHHEFDDDHSEGHEFEATTLDLGAVTFAESGGNGFIDPGDFVKLTLPIRNYVTNPLNAETIRGVHADLSTSTPGVLVVQDDSNYKNLPPGETRSNEKPFVLKLSPTFVPGTPIELALRIRSAERGRLTLLHTLFTGTPQATTLLSENFNGATGTALPAGWISAHGGGANVVPWRTNATFCGATSNAAFHTNAADGPGPGPFTNTRWERLFSPLFDVPGNAEYVTIDMDVCYDTEDDPNFNILAYDGVFLRVTDQTPGRLLRSVMVEAFEDEFTTDSFFHYPKHLPRNSNPAYFEDVSAWAGQSGGFKHVRLRLPGMAGSRAQLRFEFAQDAFATCSDVRPGHVCGVAIDNIVVRSVRSVVP
jgi:hypothetical protein